MKKILFVTLAVILLGGTILAYRAQELTASPVKTEVPVAKPINWKLITGMDRNDLTIVHFTFLVMNQINEKAGGRLKITYVGGPESYPPFEQIKPVREGVFNLLSTNCAYYAGELPVAQAIDLFPQPSANVRAAGVFDILDDIHQKKVNVKYLSNLSTGIGYNIMLKKKLEKADFTGLKIRATSIYDPLIKGLGGTTTRLPFGEIYGALEKGVVDGAAWPALGPLGFKWYEVSKYLLRPTFGSVTQTILVNLDSWKALPSDLQDLVQKIAIENENSQRAKMIELLKTEETELVKKGMELNILPGPEATKLLTTFHEKTWQELVITADPVYGPKLKAIADKLITK